MRSGAVGVTDAALPTRGDTRWPAVAACIGSGIVVAVHLGKASVALPALESDLRLELVATAAVLSMFTIVGAASGSLAGAVIGRLGPRRIAIAALGLMAAGSVAGAAAPDGPLLLASRFVESAGFLGVFVSVPALIVGHTHPRHRAVVFGLWGAHIPLGHALALALGPLVIDAWGWRALWVVAGILLMACTILLAAATRDDRLNAPSSGGVWRDLRDILAVPDVRRLGACFFCYSAQWLPVVGFLPTLYVEQDKSIQTAGLLTAVIVVVNALGNLAAGTVIRLGLPPRTVAVVASATMGACGIGIFAPDAGFVLPYVCALVFSLIGGLLPATVLASVPDAAPRAPHIPAVSGLVAQGSNLGSFLGPLAIGGLAAAAGSWSYSPLLLGGLALLGVAAALRLERR